MKEKTDLYQREKICKSKLLVSRKAAIAGITLVALVVTIVVLLILAGITITYVFGNNSVFKQATNAKEKTAIAQAREKLEIVLVNAKIEKHTNSKYSQDEYLDEMIEKQIVSAKVRGDVAIVDGYAFELDRSVPKIGNYLGKESELIFPTVTVTPPLLANDYRTASFEITAIEENNGINKIEIWFAGEKIENLTKTYQNVKTEIKDSFTVNKDGVYTIKVYGDLMESVSVEITGIVLAVEFSPNGNEEWKKEHTTKITVKETGERVTSLKYKWTTSEANEPDETEFTENCPSDNAITGKDFNGTYFLWVLLTTEAGKTNICGSKGFNFDNKGPTVTLDSTPTSETSFTLTATASDEQSEIAKYEFYIDGIKVDSQLTTEGTAMYTWSGTEMVENKECDVIVYDKLGNTNTTKKSARTLLHTWNIWDVIQTGEELEIILEDEVTEWTISTRSNGGYTYYTSENKPIALSYSDTSLMINNGSEYCKENPEDEGWLWTARSTDNYGRYSQTLNGYAYTITYSHTGSGTTVWWTYYTVRGKQIKESKNSPIYSKRI